MKVRIYQNQIVPENSDLYVLSPTGDYSPFDLIQCFKKDNRTLACCALQAQFVKFGGVVYREDEYIDVLGRLGLVDLKPETLNDMITGDKTSIVVDKDPLANLPDVTFADDEVVQPNQSIIDNTTTITDPSSATSTQQLPPVEQIPTIDNSSTASSTEQVITSEATSSPVLPDIPTRVIVPDSTSTPLIPEISEVPEIVIAPEATSSPILPVETIVNVATTTETTTPLVSSSTDIVGSEIVQ